MLATSSEYPTVSESDTASDSRVSVFSLPTYYIQYLHLISLGSLFKRHRQIKSSASSVLLAIYFLLIYTLTGQPLSHRWPDSRLLQNMIQLGVPLLLSSLPRDRSAIVALELVAAAFSFRHLDYRTLRRSKRRERCKSGKMSWSQGRGNFRTRA